MKLVLPTDTDLISSFCFAPKGASCLDWPHESCWLVYKARGEQTRPRVLPDVKSYKPEGQAREELKCRRLVFHLRCNLGAGRGVFPGIQTTAPVLSTFSFNLRTTLHMGSFLKSQRSQEKSLLELWLHWEQGRVRPQGSL